MCVMRWGVCLASLVWPLLAAGEISLDEYRARRAALKPSLDGVLVLFGAGERDDGRDGWFQDPNFLYLTGWREPGAAMLLTKTGEILFLPPRSERAERYTGKKASAEDENIPSRFGFDRALPMHKLETEFVRLLETSPKIYTLPTDRQAQKLKPLAPFHEEVDARLLIARLRMKKSPAEIELLQKAVDASVAAHVAAWKRLAPGLYEYQIAATLSNVYREHGCERNAYPPIIASGPNSVVLHYSINRRRIDAGEMVVMDAAAECSGYAADITRTVPVSGRFTPRQRELYEIVLGAQKAAIAAIKPGVRLRGEGQSLHQIALDYINSHGKDRHGDPLGKYFSHGLGHQVGLDVHDAIDPAMGLAPGMVITIEPGIYIPEEGIGIRIEDMVLVTGQGATLMTAALPREPDEIERAMGAK